MKKIERIIHAVRQLNAYEKDYICCSLFKQLDSGAVYTTHELEKALDRISEMNIAGRTLSLLTEFLYNEEKS